MEFCTCLMEIEAGINRTKFCFAPCLAQKKESEEYKEKMSLKVASIIFSSMIEILKDIKKEHYTLETFEYWWNKTRISDEHKEYVKSELINKGIIQE